jgi:hypothetical protein
LDAAEHKMRAMEAELENARKDASASNTAAGSLEREVAQAAKTSDADQRTIDALRAEIQRLKTAPPAFGQAPQTMRTGGPPMPMPGMGGAMPGFMMGRPSGNLPPPASAPGARPTTAAGRIDALLAQARFAATNMPVPTA